NRRHPYLALFDAADPNQSVSARLPTTTPTQSLYLMNSPFVHQQAVGFARQLQAVPGDDVVRVREAFVRAHGVPPTDAESREAREFLAAYRQKLASGDDPEGAAWTGLAHVLLTSNAFLYVD
ncbi:MAG: DUF1553 domain-containing protein, partial [Verrucomicrobiales bacterium]